MECPPLLRRLLAFTVLAVAPFASTGAAESRPLPVVASTTMIADIVHHLGQDWIDLHTLMGPGIDPHVFRATPRDVTRLQRAAVIFYNGHRLEGRMDDVFNRLARRGRTLVAVAEAIPTDLLLPSDDYPDAYDPHVWMDPALWSHAVTAIEESLIAQLPAHAEAIRERAAAYRRDLTEADHQARDWIGRLPPERRLLVTSHDAYNYFGRAFDFEVVGIQGLSTATEAGLADISATIRLVRERQLPAIFVETSVSPAAIRRVSRESGAAIGAELFSDALGAPGEIRSALGEDFDTGTWKGMFLYNVAAIVEALSRE
ncbi:MAG: ABC transporter substrate-binding protein [Puniceicoccaceae bacterium]|nr:MAG: ABC transporter substrate-binding protein [Puniceicoccaceae bacterium]